MTSSRPGWRGRSAGGPLPTLDLAEFLAKYGVRHRDPVPWEGGLKYTLYECPFNSEHKAKDACVFQTGDGRLGFHCFHDHCADYGWKDFRLLFEPRAYSRSSAGGQPPAPHPAEQQADVPEDPILPHVPDDLEEEGVSHADIIALVEQAIDAEDLDSVELLVPEISRLDSLAWLKLKRKLIEKFKKRFRLKDFETAIKDERRRRITVAGLPPEDTGLPEITVNNRPMRDVVAESLAALRAANDPPFLFVRSGLMVFVEVDERQRPTIHDVEKAHLRGRLDRAANYFRRGQETDIAVPPPVEVVEDILALPSAQWGIPPLEFVIEVPTLRPDGTILAARGYDPVSRMIYAPAPDFQMEPIPEYVDGDQLREAVALIDEAIGDFPYAEEKDSKGAVMIANPSRANVFGLLLTPIVRPAIAGVVPMALIDAPQAGTGKSLLVDLFAVITTGRAAAMMPFPRQEEEMQKTIGSTLLAGASLICFDNIEGILQSPNLALALTAREYQARILGVSENMVAPNRATWVATGNNIRPSGDMPRRCYHIRLDAKKSRPYQGREFKHADLLNWAREARPQLLRALLIIARAWYQRTVKLPVEDLWGSFEDWHRTIGGILRSVGVQGFLSNLQAFLNEADDMAVQWEAFLRELTVGGRAFAAYGELEAAYGPRWFKAGMLTAALREATALSPAPFTLPDSMADVDRRKEGSLEKVIGKSFAKRLGTRFGDRELHLDRQIDGHTKQSEWRVLTKDTETEVAVPAPESEQTTSF